MNLSKLRKVMMSAVLFGVVMASASGSVMPIYAAEDSSISIEKPSGWKQGETVIKVTIDAGKLEEGVTITKLEAKVGENGSWTDITDSYSISISKNETVYVRATDSEGTIYEQNRSIKCYDSEKPTLTASLTDGVLTIQGKDTISGIASITINGNEYRDLKDDTLKIQLTQKDFTTKKIEITVTDGAGNTSEKYSLQNPYYEWAVKQAIAQSADSGNHNATTTTSTGEKQEVTSPLPQDAKPSEPTTSTGTVEDRTVTGIEQELAEKNETVDTISSTTTAAGKEFYTISTKSGKVFYLVIDNEQSQDNVYFLTEVDEKDLMNFTLSDTVTLPDVDTVYATVDDEEKQTETPVTEEKPEETEAPKESEEQKSEKTSNLGSYLIIGLLAAGAGAGAWYTKIYKPKHEFDDEDEYEEFEEENETYEKDEADANEDSEPEVLEDEEE